MIYLKQFETQAAYDAAKDGLLTPNVSLITENGEIKYLKEAPAPTHEWVDLGLPSGTLWAKTNVGATNESDCGNVYMYGKGASQYYETSGSTSYKGTENPLATSADTASQEWGEDCHTPTQAQFEELTAKTTYQWTTINGVSGGKFTAQNGNYVFLPAYGYWTDGQHLGDGSYGYYWTSSPDDATWAYYFQCYNNGKYVSQNTRKYGIGIRPVKDA